MERVELEKAWNETMRSIRERTNKRNYNLWFKPIKIGDHGEGKLKLIVPNRFLKDWIQDNYRDVIERTLSSCSGSPMKVEIEAEINSKSNGEKKRAERNPESLKAKRPAPKKMLKANHIAQTRLQLLNPRFTFDNFVMGPSNQFAFKASLAVAKEPGGDYNPLIIYGGTGLGKTHLIQAIANSIMTRMPHKRVIYITAERFMTELINAISTNQSETFKRSYRDKCDVLLLDDIQFLAGKTSTQEEFFHTFNYLYDAGKQIVVTSDQYPQEIKALSERLRSRLQSGLVADIKTPDFETRSAILQNKASEMKMNMPDDVIKYLAGHIKSNVRELEGALVRLDAFSSLTGADINMNTAQNLLKGQIRAHNRMVTSEEIQRRVCRYFGISQTQMLSKSRVRKIVQPRQIGIFLAKQHTNLTLTEIGMKFGGRDHTTVLSSIQKVEQLMIDDMSIRNSVEQLEKHLEA